MNPIRDFFRRKAADKKFKSAGPAHQLDGSSSSKDQKPQRPISQQPSQKKSISKEAEQAKQAAAAAALERVQQSQSSVNWSSQAIKNQAKKELELEQARNETLLPKSKQILTVNKDIPTFTVSGVYFTCPIIGPDVLPKKEIEQKIKSFLYDQLEHERGLTACLIIHTLNKNKAQVQKGIEILARYLTNIIDEPSEEKYRKIRIKNKAFQERIANLEGAFDFLNAAGFVLQMLPSDDGEEEYLFFQDENFDIEKLQMLKEALLSAEPIIPLLDRNIKVLMPAQVVEKVNLPQDFFNLTLEEVKREQESRTETVELLSTLRTKEMRERDEIKERHLYKFSLIRIRFPDDIILQGTFSVHERLQSVREFVAENLEDPSQQFELLLPGGMKVNDDSQTLIQMKMVPAVILNFRSQNDSSSKRTFLKPECMSLLADL